MGKVAVPHSDLCGCERCAKAYESEHPRQVYDLVEDPDTLDCGCSAIYGCTCYDYDDHEDDDYKNNDDL